MRLFRQNESSRIEWWVCRQLLEQKRRNCNLMHPKPGHPGASRDLLGHRSGNLPFSGQCSGALGFSELLGRPGAEKTTKLDRKMPQSRNRHPGIFQSSQATVLKLWASPEILGPPWTQLATSLSHLDAPEAQKTTRLDEKIPQSGNRHMRIFQSSQATVLELWASPELLGPPWTQLDTSLTLGKLENSMKI